MKKILTFVLGFSLLLLVTGCQSAKSRVVEGAIIGGLLGGTAGGVVGQQSHHGGEGAAIGVATGVLTGAIVGSQIEKPSQPGQAGTATQAPNPNQMSIQQIVDLAKQGINENVIIDKILLTNSRFNLAENDINYLKQQGVSPRVIDAMQGR